MLIEIDTREKERAIKKIKEDFDRWGIQWYPQGLNAGDYRNLDNPRIIIDRKQNLSELCRNVVQQHDRFVRELLRAKEHGFHMIILVEQGGKIKKLSDVGGWYNPRLRYSKCAVTGKRLYKILKTMTEKYEFEIEFCDKKDTAKRIVELLAEEGFAWNNQPTVNEC